MVMRRAFPARLNEKYFACICPPVPRQLRWHITTKDDFVVSVPMTLRTLFIGG